MNISNNWLNDYCTHDLTPKDLSDVLTMLGLEVDDLTTVGSTLDGVVVGHVLGTNQHPNADRLTLCTVDLGEGDPVQIVCGAPNVAAGQKVPVATVGTVLPTPEGEKPFKIKKGKIRGEVSMGMICAEDELGLSDDHAGIMVLDDAATVGTPFAAYLTAKGYTLQDHVFDIAITPNRPDAISHFGVARDIAAVTGGALTRPNVTIPKAGGAAAEQVAVVIDAPEACHRYVALIVRDVTIQPSPAWLQQRLVSIGLRPRNNVVDVTNYVMYECGQPLHAFDYDEIAGHTIIVRVTDDAHAFTTLDSKERTLPKDTIMICDAEREVAIGGVMGGENSEVTDATTNVLIESAYFDPSMIRRAAKLLGLQTDASYRFERGVDSDGQAWAAARCAQLIAELGGGTIVDGMVDAHPTKPEPKVIAVRPSRIDAIIGIHVPSEDAVRLLRAIGFGVEVDGDGVLHCTVPTYRPDVDREIDMIEEVARLYGYDRIPDPAHSKLPNFTPQERPVSVVRSKVRHLLAGLGYRETYTNSMLRTDVAERFNLEHLGGPHAHGPVVTTLKPISEEMAALRPSLLPGLLQVMQHNQNHGQDRLRYLEFGHVFHRTERQDTTVPGYFENEALLIALSGPNDEITWDGEVRNADFFDLKGAVEAMLQELRIPKVKMEAMYDATDATSYHLNVYSRKTHLGIIARLSDTLAAAYDLRAPAFFAEFNAERLVERAAAQLRTQYTPVSRFPIVERDLAVLVDEVQPAGPMLDAISASGRPLLQAATVFDVYQGQGVPDGHKSVAFALRFGADRTLKDSDVDKRVQQIVRRLEGDFNAKLRD